MGTIFTMAVKDLRLMSRDWLGMFFIIVFPIAMGIFFGTIMGSMGDKETTQLGVAIVDEDDSPMSKQFVDELVESGNVDVEKHDRKTAMERVRRGQLVGMIVVPKDFSKTAGVMWLDSPTIEIGVDPSRKAEAGMLKGIIMQSMGKLMFARFEDPAAMRPLIESARADIANSADMPALQRLSLVQLMDSLEGWRQSLEKTQATPESEKDSVAGENGDDPNQELAPEFELAKIETIDVTQKPEKGSTGELMQRIRSEWDISFPQAMMWGVLACAAGFAITFVRERKQGTLLRLRIAPISRAQLVAGKATACFAAVIGVIGVMVALGVALGMRPVSPALLVLAATCIATCFVGIMMLMSVVGKTEEAVSGAVWGANLLMAMFGGGMIPLLFMPPFMRTLSNLSPVKWSVLALEGAIWRGFTLGEMLLPCVILVAVGATCMTIGTVALKRVG